MTLLRSRPLRQKSDKAKARDLVLAGTKRELRRDFRLSCEVMGCMSFRDRLDLHHVWGRGNIIGQPWCDSAECCADWAVHTAAPTWLRRAGLDDQAALLDAASAASAAYAASAASVRAALRPTVVELQKSALGLLDRLIAAGAEAA